MTIDNQKIKIGASCGLLAIAVVHAILLALALNAPEAVHQWRTPAEPAWQGPGLTSSDLPANHGTNYDSLPGVRASAVRSVGPINTAARDEIKHGLFGRRVIVTERQPSQCVNCRQPQRVNPAPQYPVVHQPQPTYPPPKPQPGPLVLPVPPSPAKPASGKNEIALFVDGSTQSQQLQQWFMSDPQLVKLRDKCSFQVYTADNGLYKSRFEKTVPRELFPALLFLRPDGGHIHAAGGANLPTAASTLYADLKASYELMQQMEAASKPATTPPLLRAVSNAFEQSSDYCPDGLCPEDRSSVFPLRDRKPASGTIQGLLRDLANTGSETTIAAIALIVLMFLGCVIIINRRQPPTPPAVAAEPWLV